MALSYLEECRWILTSTTARCDICGFDCGPLHYADSAAPVENGRQNIEHHCEVCHPPGKEWARAGDSEPRNL